MSKIATYLQSHISGEVTTQSGVRDAMERDASVCRIQPEMVIYPMVTNDVRKVARFSWQLALKGHLLPITARGGGSDQTGAALTPGVSLVFPAHMDRVFEFDPKQRLVRVQPGIMFKALNDALALHGMMIPSAPVSAAYSTIGGALANNATGPLSGKYGDTRAYTNQLEVVLANGDVIQTGRISRKELDRRKGREGLEGDIYRGIDAVIEDNAELIDQMRRDPSRNNIGYAGIADVKRRDGSFDLTPLFVGSQGTLGIISEVIMQATELAQNHSVAIFSFRDRETAHDAIDVLRQRGPAYLEYYDGAVFEYAARAGKTYEFYRMAREGGEVVAVVVVGFDDTSDRARAKQLKKLLRYFAGSDVVIATAEGDGAYELMSLHGASHYSLVPEGRETARPPVADGFYVPYDRFEEFHTALKQLETTLGMELLLSGRMLESNYYVRPSVELKRSTDRTKLFKIMDALTTLITAHGGHLVAEAGEGRLLGAYAHKNLDEAQMYMIAEIKRVCDPHGILNPGVKTTTTQDDLAHMIKGGYDLSQFAQYSPSL